MQFGKNLNVQKCIVSPAYDIEFTSSEFSLNDLCDSYINIKIETGNEDIITIIKKETITRLEKQNEIEKNQLKVNDIKIQYKKIDLTEINDLNHLMTYLNGFD